MLGTRVRPARDPFPIEDLPNELIALILAILPPRDYARAARCCKRMWELCKSRAYWMRALRARDPRLAASLPRNVHPRSAYDDVLHPPRRMREAHNTLLAWWRSPKGGWRWLTVCRANPAIAPKFEFPHTTKVCGSAMGMVRPFVALTIPMEILWKLSDRVGTLVASRVALERVPATLCMLTLLHTLDLRDNQIVTIPEASFDIPALRDVRLGGNRIKSLAGVRWPEGLTCLDVSRNRLEELPAALAALVGLVFLDVSGNRLRELPGGLCNLPCLATLDVSRNALRAEVDACTFVAGTDVIAVASLHSDW